MLVLSRHADESIIIGNSIAVRLNKVRGDKVSVCVIAPKEIPVHRSKVYEKILDDCRSAKQPLPQPLPVPEWAFDIDREKGLAFTMKLNDSFVINNGYATIYLVDIRGDKARFGIEAHQDIPVHRREVYEAIQRYKEPSDIGNT